MSDLELAQDEQPVEATSEAAAASAPEDVAEETTAPEEAAAEQPEPAAPAPESALDVVPEETAAPEEAAPEADEQPEPAVPAPVEDSPVEEPVVAAVEAEEEATPEAETTPADDEDGDSQTIFNLEPRQHLSGKVKNITTFGAFVDLGLPQDGLIHISELSRRKVEKVEDVVSVGQDVDVWVKKVDRKRGRISLTMIKPVARRVRDIEEEEEIAGTVTRLESFGAFVDIDSERDGLVHISQITHDYIKHPQEALEVGQTVNVKVLKVNRKKRQIDLSIKALLPPPVVEAPAQSEAVREKPAKDPEPEFSLQEQEPVPTAMAVAFASLQENDPADDSGASGIPVSSTTKESSRRKREQEEIIARLANS